MIRLLLVVLTLLCAMTPAPTQAYETMQMVSPRATGAAGSGWHASNRIYRAYSGIPYVIPTTVIGGHPPYRSFSLSGAPSGMTIDSGPCTTIGPTCTAGTITWSSPSAACSTCTAGVTAPITVTVTDQDGTQVTGTWSITISTAGPGTDGFCFLDATSGNDTTGSGTLASPWQTLNKAKANCGVQSIIYFRAGTYVTTGISGAGVGSGSDYGNKVSWNTGTTGVIWIGYPGETVTIDFAYTGTPMVEYFELSGANIWIENIGLYRVGNMALNINTRSSNYGATLYKVRGESLLDGINGNNSAYAMWTDCVGCQSYFDRVIGSTFTHMRGSTRVSPSTCAIKFYATIYSVVESSTFDDSDVTNEAVIAYKKSDSHFTNRYNKINITTNSYQGIGGNFNSASAPESSGGEIYHNLMTSTGGGAIDISTTHIGDIARVDIYRNTFLGVVTIAGAAAAADHLTSADGPFVFTSNVIVNAGGTGGSCPARITCSNVDDYTVIQVNANNLQGANDGTIANATTGVLINRALVGTVGFEFSEVTSSPRFAPRLNLRVALVEP